MTGKPAGIELPALCLITDRHICKGKDLIEAVAGALASGVRLVQLREKDLSGKGLFEYGAALRELTSRHNALLIINGRADAALAVNADGVHLGHADCAPKEILPYLKKGMITGVSTHSVEEAIKAEKDGAHYITFGPIWHTPSKARYGEPIGLEKLRQASAAVSIPVFAIGGVNAENARKALGAGARGVAVISAILARSDTAKSAGEMLKAIQYL